MNETENNTQLQKPKTSKLAIGALLLGVGSLCTLGMVEPHHGLTASYIYALLVLRASAIGALVVGTIAIMVISIRGSAVLKGRAFAIVGMTAAVVSLILGRLGLAPRPASPSPGRVCGTNLSVLGKALHIYAGDYDDQYPTADKWCDLLVAYIDVSPKQFVCKGSDAKIGESSYAFNKNLIGKRPAEVPPDVVLLFETNFGKNPAGRQELLGNRDWYKELSSRGDRWDLKWIKKYRSSEKVYKQRWNQVGGPEILTTENHKGQGCFILFNDSHIEFVKPERLGELKWEAEEGEE